jgi:hypothetical protein
LLDNDHSPFDSPERSVSRGNPLVPGPSRARSETEAARAEYLWLFDSTESKLLDLMTQRVRRHEVLQHT